MAVSFSSAPLTLGVFGSSPNANALTITGNKLVMQPANVSNPGGVSIAPQTFAGAKTFAAQILSSDGTTAAPGISFSADTTTGFYRGGANDLVAAVGGTLALEINKLSATQMNFGLGGPAGGSIGSALSAAYTYNGNAAFNYSNLSQGAAAVTQFYIGSGASGGNGITIENQAYATIAYTGGGALVSAGPNLSFLNICAENAAAYMTFNVGGRTLATERMRLSLTALTISKGTNLALSGATSGAISINAAAATTSYSITYPAAQGANGTVLQNDSTGALTWVATLTNPMTTKGDIIGTATGTPVRVPAGLNGQYLVSDSTATNGVSYQNPANYKNHLVNSAFDIWQVAISNTQTSLADGVTPTSYLLPLETPVTRMRTPTTPNVVKLPSAWPLMVHDVYVEELTVVSTSEPIAVFTFVSDVA